jgi:hypothetical protein
MRLFPRENQVYLFDFTNTYFEGNEQNNELAQRGRSMAKRSGCSLVTLFVVDDAGFTIFLCNRTKRRIVNLYMPQSFAHRLDSLLG